MINRESRQSIGDLLRYNYHSNSFVANASKAEYEGNAADKATIIDYSKTRANKT